MQVAKTRESLILALKNDKNSDRWEKFVNQYWDYLRYAACARDNMTGRAKFVPEGVDPDEAVEQTLWQLKNIILPDEPQFDVDFTEKELEKKIRHGLKWRIFELEKGKLFRNYLLSVLKNVARTLYNRRQSDRLVFVANDRLDGRRESTTSAKTARSSASRTFQERRTPSCSAMSISPPSTARSFSMATRNHVTRSTRAAEGRGRRRGSRSASIRPSSPSRVLMTVSPSF